MPHFQIAFYPVVSSIGRNSIVAFAIEHVAQMYAILEEKMLRINIIASAVPFLMYSILNEAHIPHLNASNNFNIAVG